MTRPAVRRPASNTRTSVPASGLQITSITRANVKNMVLCGLCALLVSCGTPHAKCNLIQQHIRPNIVFDQGVDKRADQKWRVSMPPCWLHIEVTMHQTRLSTTSPAILRMFAAREPRLV